MKVPGDLAKVKKYMENYVGLGVSFDIGVREITLRDVPVQIYYVNGLCDTAYIIEIMETLLGINEFEKIEAKDADIYELVKNRLVQQSVEVKQTMDEMVDQVLSGLIAVIVDGSEKALIVDVRSYPGRTPQEPDTERITRGARDGYVENIIVNTALTRRRIRDERLRFEIMRVGERSKTDIAIGYIEGIANPHLVEIIKRELGSIKTDGLTMAEKTVEEYLVKENYNPYPLVRYTERADVGANHLFEGHVLIFVDTSPSIMIAPTTFFHHVQHAEEYRQSASVGTIIRWFRFIGIFASLFLIPLWLLFVLEPQLLPKSLEFIGPNEDIHVHILLQVAFAEIGIELLRIASIHTPAPLSSAMGLIAAVLIGQIAIDVGWIVPEVLFYISIATIGSFATPSLELGLANKYVRYVLLILTGAFHVPGFIIGNTLFILYLSHINTLSTPYLWPFIPFSPKALWQIVVRKPVPGSHLRPRILHTLDRKK
ncbi:stage V sporulation protein AF [Bacillus sp. FJAT-27916]|uniref:spore germination protein n=1 Tax=Bacillus sp. FJAT-27916 TaxID=1679169 RepID=UPI000670AE66|nr:spore germination protein [Bacillus sp. FJAT-27916]KMY46379.1 stage V sporulation protein AF [Bacillus sp. FJAT-27916]